MNGIVAKGVHKRFGAHEVLRGLDLTVPVGGVYGLLGRNAAGKTTFFHLLDGLLVPDAGKIELAGRAIYVGDTSVIPSWMRVRDLVDFESSEDRALDKPHLEGKLAAAQIPLASYVKSLSKGQRRRLELEVALACRPAVLLLDEPLDGYDPVARAEVMVDLLERAAEMRATVLVASHVLGDLERMCNLIGVLAGGRIVFESPLDDLKESVSVVTTSADHLPFPADVIARQGSTFIVGGLRESQEHTLRERGDRVARPGLEELGIDLLRCLDARQP
jgi:ABC-2 type transport system ATP-binding protein